MQRNSLGSPSISPRAALLVNLLGRKDLHQPGPIIHSPSPVVVHNDVDPSSVAMVWSIGSIAVLNKEFGEHAWACLDARFYVEQRAFRVDLGDSLNAEVL
uniref:Uncharacterized protein n=1 Tax=Micrurus spixii TaxID=129469 RepID=A0A2D4MN44_9SAUR